MNDFSATRIIRWFVSVPLSLCAAVTAMLWAWPKSGEGGFVWMLSLPVGLGIVYLTHRLTAPPRAPRSIGVPIALTAGLAALTIGGIVLGSMVLPVDNPSDLAIGMMGMTLFWPLLAALALGVVAVLKLIDHLVRRSRKRSELRETVPAAQSPLPVPADSAPLGLAGTSRPVGTSPSPSPMNDSQAPEELATPAADPTPGAAAFTDASFLELSTLVEVAASLEEAANPTMMLLSFSSDGAEVSASGTELGTVDGSWSGTGTVRTLQSARALLEALAGLSPAPTTLSLRPPTSEDEDLEVLTDTGARVGVVAVRA